MIDPKYHAFLLYGAPAPGSKGITGAETPTLQPFLLEPGKKNSGTTIVVCPGGGYQGLAPHEGEPVARWLNSLGINAFVLRYRLKPHIHPVPMNDAKRAMRFVRHHAATWNLDSARIGILGFSAGGHLCTTAATQYDAGNPESPDPIERVSSRPAVQLLIYPVITTTDTKIRSCFVNIFGTEEAVLAAGDTVNSDTLVNAQTPPAFVFHSTIDQIVPVEHADRYVAALKKHNVPCTYVRGEYGLHGIGLHEWWTPAAANFLREQSFA
jgi:acetyl esterase/lipase